MAKKKRVYHPPLVCEYYLPNGDQPSYIRGKDNSCQGFGRRDYYVAQISARQARETIQRKHYSHTVVNNSYVHLGVYLGGQFVGVLQFGYLLNPARAGRIVKGTVQGQYLELNRMWLDDIAPRNSESQAISYAIKFIKRACPTVAWIQSFADERCGGLGVVYQASNFLYLGCHKTSFYMLDGRPYHPMLLTAHKKSGQRGRTLRENLHRAKKMELRQFRYIFFVKKRWQKRLNFEVLPFPKPNKEKIQN